MAIRPITSEATEITVLEYQNLKEMFAQCVKHIVLLEGERCALCMRLKNGDQTAEVEMDGIGRQKKESMKTMSDLGRVMRKYKALSSPSVEVPEVNLKLEKVHRMCQQGGGHKEFRKLW